MRAGVTAVAATSLLLGLGTGAYAWAGEGALRVLDGDGMHAAEGRLEVFLEGRWGVVCDDEFGEEEAQVACGQLGMSGGTVRRYPDVPRAAAGTPILMDNVRCIGTESRLVQCQYHTVENCFLREAVGVTCTAGDDVDTVISVTADAASVTEGEDAGFTLTRTGDVEDGLSLTAEVYESGAMLASPAETREGTPILRTVRFAANATTTRLVEATVDDATDEPDSLVMVCPATDGGDVYRIEGPVYASMIVLDNDDAPTTVSVADAIGTEDSVGNLEFAVTLSGRSAVDVVVDYATSDGTATAGADYTGTAGTLTLSAGDTTTTIHVPVLPDGVDEPDEAFTLTLSNARNAMRGRGSATGTIRDDDVASTGIVLTVVPSRVAEGAGATEVSVTATLDRSPRTVRTAVTVSVSGSGVAEAVDFAAVPNFDVEIAPGATGGTATFILSPEDDQVDEADETLTLAGSSDLPVTRAAVTLADDDAASTEIALSAMPTQVLEGAGEAVVVVTATLNGGARTAPMKVTVSASGSGVAEAVDFAAVSDFEIGIAAGAPSGVGTFVLVPDDDFVDEADETLTLDGSSGLPVTPASLTLVDDDATSTEIVLAVAPPQVSEGAGATDVSVTAALDGGARTGATTVTVSVSGSGDADAVDFAVVSDFEIEVAAGATGGTGTFTLEPDDDRVDETDETLTLAGMSDLPVLETSLTLTDDDATSTGIGLTAAPSRVSEGAGATEVTVTATLDGGARLVATAVTVSVSGSGDADAVDFAVVSDFEIGIAAGATSAAGTFILEPDDDRIDEADETLTLTGGSDLPVTETSLTLTDDDATSTGVVLAAVPANVSEGAGATEVTVTATLDGGARPVATAVTVSVSGSGDPDVVGFAPVMDFGIGIAPGATGGVATFTLSPEDDNLQEANETLTLGGAADLDVTAATITLADDDAASTGIVLSVAPARVMEDRGPVEVAVTASLDRAARSLTTTVAVSVSGSGDADAVGFAAVRDFDIEIAPGATSGTATFTLEPDDDRVDEPDETLTLAGSSDLPVADATLTLADDDATSTEIMLTAVPTRVSEGAGATEVAVTATLDGGARTRATTVSVALAGSGDADAVGFAAVPGFDIGIAAAATSGSAVFTLEPDDDRVDAPDAILTLTGSSDLPVTDATLTLADDDATSTEIVLAAVPTRVSEGAGATEVAVTATLDGGARTVATAVAVAVAASGDADAVDFAPVAGFGITIPAGATQGGATFTLEPVQDQVDEADETLRLTGTSVLPVTAAAVTLADDDAPSTGILLAAAPPWITEGGGATEVTVTATMNRGARPVGTVVTVSVTGSGAPDVVGHAAVPAYEIGIPADALSGAGTFTLTPENDRQVEADETLTISGTADLPVTSTTVTLADDDEVSTRVLLFLVAEPARALEGDGPVRVTVTAQLDRGVRPRATRIAISVTGSGDPDAVDFAPVADFEIGIPADALDGEGAFTVTPEDDEFAETDEVLTVSGSADLPVTPATVILLDDEEASTGIRLAADRTSLSEGGGPVSVAVTATLDRDPRQRPTVVTLSVAGSGDPDAVDFAPVADFGIGIDAGALSGRGTFTVTPEDDSGAETDEILTVSGESDLPVGSLTLTLVDDDAGAMQTFRVLLFESAAHPVRQGFLRVINHSAESGEVRIDAVDDGGTVRDPVTLSLAGGEAAHFNSDDLEDGNAEKGLSGGVGRSGQGDWHLELSSELDIEVLAYARTADGFVTTMHDAVPVADGEHGVSFFNPGRNLEQRSLLRLVNTGAADVEAKIVGSDDAGAVSDEVQVAVPARMALTLTAAELESGVAAGIDAGALGTGSGKWRLRVLSPSPLAVKSLLASPAGYLANVSTSPRTPGSAAGAHGVPLLPSMSSDLEGVVRVVNHSDEAGEVRIAARDDTAFEYQPVMLDLVAGGAAHFTSSDLELGDADKGLEGSTGAGTGPWRLDLTSGLDIEVLSYVRAADGFPTPVHDLAPTADGVHRVVFFNPASNAQQRSRLRLINAGASAASVTVTGVDDTGMSPGTAVRLTVAAGTALEVSSSALESGDGEGIDGGALGDGVGKWRLRVESDRPVQVMSLLDSPTGHLSNLSSALDGARRP